MFDEADLNEVTSVAPHTTLDYQLEQLRAGSYCHPARKAYVFNDVHMVDGHFFKMKMIHPMAHRKLPSIGTRSMPEISSGVLGTSEYGNKYFGHWFSDDVPMTKTARQFGKVYGHVNADNVLIGHQKAYANLLDWNIDLVEKAHFRELTILDWSPMTPRHADRFAHLRSRLPVDWTQDNPGVLLLRKSSGQQRFLTNESEIAEVVRRRGFKVIDPMLSSVEELVKVCSNAQIVMGVEGSQLAHGFLPLAPAGTFFTLQPPFKFDHFWKSRCDCIGARYAFVVGTQTDEGSFTVSADRVERMLDRIQNSAAA